MWNRKTTAIAMFSAAMSALTIPVHAEEAVDTAAFTEQIETQIRTKIEEGWLNPACVLLVTNDGAFVVTDDGKLQPCPTGKCQQLVNAGLLKKGRSVSPDKVVSSYVITDKARPYLEPHQSEPRADKLCFAKATLERVVSASTIAPLGQPFNQVQAQYTVKLADKAPWATSTQFKKAFPAAGNINSNFLAQAEFTREGDTLQLKH